MTTVSIQEAEAKLSELIRKLKPGDEIVITDNNQPVARLVPAVGRPPCMHRQALSPAEVIRYEVPTDVRFANDCCGVYGTLWTT